MRKLAAGAPAAYAERMENGLAEADFAEAVRLNPADPKTYAARGWFYSSNEDKERAKADFEQSIKLADKAIEDKQDPAGAYYRAEAYAGIEDYGRALADYDEALTETG